MGLPSFLFVDIHNSPCEESRASRDDVAISILPGLFRFARNDKLDFLVLAQGYGEIINHLLIALPSFLEVWQLGED